MERCLALKECCIQVTTRETFNGCKQTVQRPIHSISDAQRRRQRCVKCWMSFLQQVTHFNHSGSERKQENVNIHLPSLTSPWSLRRILAPWRQEKARHASARIAHTIITQILCPLTKLLPPHFIYSWVLCTHVLCALMQIITIFKWRIIKIEVQKDF